MAAGRAWMRSRSRSTRSTTTPAEVVRLQLKVSRDERAFRVRARAPLSDLPHGGASDAVWLRLRLTWRNSSWETEVARPAALSLPEARALQRAAG